MTRLLTIAVLPMWLLSATGWAAWVALHALTGRTAMSPCDVGAHVMCCHDCPCECHQEDA